MADPTMSRQPGGLDLTPETQAQIWQDAARTSAFMQLAQQISLPGKGVRVPIIVGEPEADWVQEKGVKPKTGVTFSKKDMVPYTIAAIMPFSNQFRRDYSALYDQVVAMGPSAIAKVFDETIMGVRNKPGADFDSLSTAKKISLGSNTNVWKALNQADDSITDADGTLDGWALAPQGRSILRQATDTNGRPLFLSGVGASDISTILGQPTYVSKGVRVPESSTGTGSSNTTSPEIVGAAGDFASASWGSVEGMQTSISDQATLNIDGQQVNLWEQNMFAVRIEIEVGFRIRDINRFVLLTK